jgi:AcrR family transcriptional regulator
MSDPARSVANRRERQAAQKLDQILDAAASLFAQHGFHRTTTKDIAQAADVSEGTLYNYFDNKNDLLFSILERLGEYELPTNWESETLSVDAREFMVQMLQLRRSFVDQNSVMLQAILSEILANTELRERYNAQMIAPTVQAIEENLSARVSTGQLDSQVDVPATARLVISLYLGLFILQVLGDPLVKNEWDRLVETFIRMVFDGISP